jgi:hypothetical protein
VPLFDVAERTDTSYASHAEDSFSFLNRVSGAYWERVRVELDLWFSDYATCAPSEKVADLRARLRSRDPRQHFPAWWELYLFRLLRRSFPQASVLLEPQGRSVTARPDFAVIGGRSVLPKLYVEAVQPATGIQDDRRHAAREAGVLDAINEIEECRFWLHIEFPRVGPQTPKKAKLTQPIREWLRTLDPDRPGHCERSFGEAGWEIRLRASPRAADLRTGGRRLIGVGPTSAGFVSDVVAVRTVLEQKARRYGDLHAPFVVAVMPSSPFDMESAFEVFYGREAVTLSPDESASARLIRLNDGFWTPEKRRVSAVLLGPGVLPWTIVQTSPTLWLNPYAEHPLATSVLPVPLVCVDERETVREIEACVTLAQLFELADDWPGPEPPFDLFT